MGFSWAFAVSFRGVNDRIFHGAKLPYAINVWIIPRWGKSISFFRGNPSCDITQGPDLSIVSGSGFLGQATKKSWMGTNTGGKNVEVGQ